MRKFTLLFALSCCCFFARTQNVGVGTAYPNNGRLVIRQTGSNSVVVVNDSATGISFCESGQPTINFNNYYRSGRKMMDDGYASYFFFNPSNGNLYYNNSATTATQGSATPTLTNRLTINSDGDMGLGTTAPASGMHLRNKTLLIDNTSGFSDMIFNPAYNSWGGGIELQNTSGVKTTVLRAADASGQSGELIFYDPTDNSSTMELDGDYAGTGRSRIIVDELQIKGGSDFAEFFDVAPAKNIEPEAGMLVSIDESQEGKLTISQQAYDKKVAGVISGAGGIKPGMMMGHKSTIADGKFPVAITGRVYVKAEAVQAAIQPGDLLTTSSLPGYAMKAISRNKSQGAIIGKAMSKLEKGKKGLVLLLLSIQ